MRWQEIIEAKLPDDFIPVPKPDLEGLGMYNVLYSPGQGFVWIEVIQAVDRGQGIGSAVLQHIESWARENGAREIRGEALINSVGFWKKQGFSVGKPNSKNRCPMKKSLLL